MEVKSLSGKPIDVKALPDMQGEMVNLITDSELFEFLQKYKSSFYFWAKLSDGNHPAQINGLQNRKDLELFLRAVDHALNAMSDNKLSLKVVVNEN